MADSDAAENLPVEEWTERADPGVAAKGSERLADEHQVRLGDTDVQRTRLIDGRNAGLEAARCGEIGVDRDDGRIPRKDLHCSRHDVCGTVLLAGIEDGQRRRIVMNPL